MTAYLAKVWDHLSSFETWQIMQIPKAQNTKVDSLAKLAFVPSSKLSKTILVECLEAPSTHDKELLSLAMNLEDGW